MRKPLLAVAALLVVAGTALPALASPQPTPVCGACGGSFETAARDYVENATVTHSTAVVDVHENGSATWHVRNRLRNASTARFFRNHPDVLSAVSRDAISTGLVDDRLTRVDARVENRTVVVVFRQADAVDRRSGVLVSDYLHTHGRDAWPTLTADNLTLVGPPGTVVTNDPAGATVSGRRATWHGNGSAPRYEAPTAPTDAYVVFGDPGPLAGLWAGVAVALATLPTVVRVTTTFLLPPLALFAGLLAVVARVETAVERRVTPGRRRVAGLVAALGVLGVATTAAGLVSFGTARSTAEFGVLALAMGGVVLLRGDDATLRDVLLAGAAGLVVCLVAVVPLLAGTPVGSALGDAIALREVSRLVPFVLAPALGAVPSGRTRARLLAGTVVVGGFLLAEFSTVWPTRVPFGAVVFFLGALAVVVAVASLPFVLLGRAVAPGE